MGHLDSQRSLPVIGPDVLREITRQTGYKDRYKPVAFVVIDDNWTALRFKRT